MPNKNNDIILTVEHLSVRLSGKVIFDNVNLSLRENEKCVIYGKSGCGKSTFLLTLLGFIPDFSGEIIFNQTLKLSSETIFKIRQFTAWVPQETALHFNNGKELFDTLFSLKNNKHLFPSSSEINTTLSVLNLDAGILDKPFSTLSGGEKQRLLIAAGLLQKKPLLLLDEPTSALDKANRSAVINAIKNYPFACIAVSHDNELIDAFDKPLNFETFAQ